MQSTDDQLNIETRGTLRQYQVDHKTTYSLRHVFAPKLAVSCFEPQP